MAWYVSASDSEGKSQHAHHDELRAALATGAWDAVLSDYTLPVFGAEDSLAIVREFDPDLPFIVVSGTVGEEVVVQIMRAGASDYVLKHALTQLAPALVRELREAENRRARKQADRAMRASETRYRRLFEAAQDGVLIVDVISRQILDANPFLTSLLGYPHTELVGKELWEIGLFHDIEANKAAFRMLQEQGYIRYDDFPLETMDGHWIDVEFVSNIYDVGEDRVIQCNIRDISARKRPGPINLLITDFVMPGAGGRPYPNRLTGDTPMFVCCTFPGTRMTRSSDTVCCGRGCICFRSRSPQPRWRSKCERYWTRQSPTECECVHLRKFRTPS